MKFSRCLLQIIVFLLLSFNLHAEERKYYLKSLDISDGLSQNTVNCILQDKLGFIWFGTKEGLNRYDGSSFTIFKQEIDGYIRVLYEDDHHRLWVGTSSGVYVYLMKEETFVRFSTKTANGLQITKPVNNIVKDKAGILWISTEKQGVFSFDEKANVLTNYAVNGNSLENCDVRNFLIDSSNRFWFMLNHDGLFYSDDKMKTAHQYLPKEDPFLFEGSFVTDMLLSGKKLYIISNNSGLVELNTITGKIDRLFFHDNNRQLFMRKIIFHTDDEMWIGTETGVYIFNLKTRKYVNIVHTDGDPYSLSDNAIHSLYKDRQGGIWIGSYFGGINYYPQQHTYFEKYYRIPGKKGLKGRRIRELCENKDGKIFVGTEDGGLHLFNPKTKEINPFGDAGIYHNIHGLCLDSDNLWVGTYSKGLYIIDASTGKIKKHYRKNQPEGLINNDIFTIYKDKNNLIWIGTGNGLQYYDRKNDRFISVPELKGYHIRDIKADASENIYCATSTNGLYYYNKKKNKWYNYMNDLGNPESLPQNNIVSIFEDSRSQIWLTTQGGGFCKFLPEEGKFVRFSSKDMVANNVVYQILEDDNGSLWISTNEGLVLFNTETSVFSSYKIYDGLPSKQFNYKSALKSSEGLLLFGSINGFVVFDPSSFMKNEYIPSLVLTDFLLFNKRVKPGKDTPLKESIVFSDRIKLAHDQNSFSIRFTSLDYYASELNQFQYMLEGFDSEWQTTSDMRSVTYSNIKHGDYVFKVRAANSSGIWNEKPTLLYITILPPWWLSSIAYLVYIFLFMLLAYIAYLYVRQRQKQKQERQREFFMQEKEREVYTAKIDFFTNIAHEIRTPLTLIKSPLENIIRNNKELPAEVQEDLDVVNRNTNRLLDLTNQLLDFRKIEKQGFQLKFVKCNVSEILRETFVSFNLLAKEKGLKFEMELPEKDFYAVLDRDSVIKIISNLFTNAIKNSASYVAVSLQLKNTKEEEPSFDIIVQNDGPVIPASQRDEIFKPFVQYQLNENNLKAGTGLGLALARSLAELHRGSLSLDNTADNNQFRLSLPILIQEDVIVKEETETFEEETDELVNALPEAAGTHEKPLLLVVEDDKDLLSYMIRLLSNDYAVISADNGEKAIKLLEKHVVNLILSDVMMPQMDGFELCRIIKSDLSSSHIPVILLTAKTDLQAKIEGMELGADAYIEKPFDNDFLLASISNLLSGRKKMIESFSKSPFLFSGTSSISKADEAFMKSAHAIIQNNIQNPDFSKEDLADELNLSRSSLYRKIKGLFGVSPNEFIRMERLKKAAQLLQEGEDRISEISYSVGFNSASYFTKCFVKQFGVHPKDFVER